MKNQAFQNTNSFIRTMMFILLMLASPVVLAQKAKVSEYYELGLEAFNKGMIRESIHYANQALDIDEYNTDVLYLRANAYEQDSKIAEAIIDYEKITLSDESYLEAYLAKAILYYKKKNYEEALKNIVSFENYNGNSNTRALLFKSQTFGEGKSKGISGVTSVEGLEDDILYYKALIYRDQGKYVKARDILKSLINKKRSAENHVALGLVYQKMNKNDSAVYAYRTALNLEPSNNSAAYQLLLIDPAFDIPSSFKGDDSFHYSLAKQGYDLFQQGRYSNALEMYNKAIKLAPEDPDYRASRGLVYEKLMRYDEAISDYRAALRKDSNFVANYYRIGNVLFRKKSFEEAIAHYTIYLSYEPTDENVLYNQGMAFLSIKNFTDGCLSLKKAKINGKEGLDQLINKYCRNN